RLVALPPGARPHEGLVEEARRQQRRGEFVGVAKVEGERRPAVLALGDEAVVKLSDGRPHVGLASRSLTKLDERVRLLDAGREEPARPVVLEAAADEMNAVRQQGGGQGVAGMALVGPPVEGEAENARAVQA